MKTRGFPGTFAPRYQEPPWGNSVPLAVPKAMQEMKRRGKNASYVDQVAYQNPTAFMSQSPRFSEPEGV